MNIESNLKSSRDMAFVVYILYIYSYFTDITSIIRVNIAYVKRGERK
jgi:uncharacterized membrane protein